MPSKLKKSMSSENSRKNLELENLELSNQKLIVEIGKIERETFFYPLVVGSGILLALAAVLNLFF